MNSAGQSRTYEFTDNLSWVKGRHAFKFGMDAAEIARSGRFGIPRR